MSAEHLSRYHDAELNGLDTSDSFNVTLWFAMVGGQRSVLKLMRCEFFRVSDYRRQNVVSRLLIFANEGVDDVYIAERLRWATSSSDSSSFLSSEKVDEIIKKIHLGSLKLLVLEPSWGAEIVILFQAFSSD